MPASVQHAKQIALILPSGELRQGTTDELIATFDRVLAADFRVVVLSMREVRALLSEGIRSLVMLRDRVCASDRAFYLTDLATDVRYTLKITNLLEFLNHVPTLADAVKQYGVSADGFVAWDEDVTNAAE